MVADEKIKEKVKKAANEGTSENKQKSRTDKLKENLKESMVEAGGKAKEKSKEYMQRLLKEGKAGGSTAGKKVKELAANIVVRGKDTANALGEKPDVSLGMTGEMTPKVSVDLGVGQSGDKAKKESNLSLGNQEINFMGKEKNGNQFFERDENDLDLF